MSVSSHLGFLPLLLPACNLLELPGGTAWRSCLPTGTSAFAPIRGWKQPPPLHLKPFSCPPIVQSRKKASLVPLPGPHTRALPGPAACLLCSARSLSLLLSHTMHFCSSDTASLCSGLALYPVPRPPSPHVFFQSVPPLGPGFELLGPSCGRPLPCQASGSAQNCPWRLW